jgi:hypothetical protein
VGIDYGVILSRDFPGSFNGGNPTVVDENIGSFGLCACAVDHQSAADKNRTGRRKTIV